MKHVECNTLWFETPSELEIDIHYRMTNTHSKSTPLKHFDSLVMKKYHTPHKALEINYCQLNPTFCESYDEIKRKVDVPLSDLDVKMSSIGEGSGRGLFAAVQIKKGSTIGVAETRFPVYVHPSSVSTILEMKEVTDEIGAVWNYIDGYGWEVSVPAVSISTTPFLSLRSHIISPMKSTPTLTDCHNVDTYTGLFILYG